MPGLRRARRRRARQRALQRLPVLQVRAEHREAVWEKCGPDAWGEGISPEQIVAQARRMREPSMALGPSKLKGGVFDPAHEVACMVALSKAFPGVPLRLDPNANWTLETSIKHAPR